MRIHDDRAILALVIAVICVLVGTQVAFKVVQARDESRYEEKVRIEVMLNKARTAAYNEGRASGQAAAHWEHKVELDRCNAQIAFQLRQLNDLEKNKQASSD